MAHTDVVLPALPSLNSRLDELTFVVAAGSHRLGQGLPTPILAEVGRHMLAINSYYTNSMEGNPSKLKDIEAALEKRLAKESSARNHQLEHAAHIEVQKAMVSRLEAEPELSICSGAFLSWLHDQFFQRLPEELRHAITESGDRVPVTGGELRTRGVTVGRHEAPATKDEIARHLKTFEELLDPRRLSGTERLLGFASSHHRFLWIHPFPEGNGRVGRLLTQAYAVRAGLGSTGLWSVSRAFARDRKEYDRHLALADMPRRNDLDGRGPLSQEGLTTFCEYFLACCDDQIDYMTELLELRELEDRWRLHLQSLAAAGKLSRSAAAAAGGLIRRGELPRGEVAGLARVKKRRATQIVRELLDARLVRSETPYGPLLLNVTADSSPVLFPSLA